MMIFALVCSITGRSILTPKFMLVPVDQRATVVNIPRYMPLELELASHFQKRGQGHARELDRVCTHT
jgi:hypothetical protein